MPGQGRLPRGGSDGRFRTERDTSSFGVRARLPAVDFVRLIVDEDGTTAEVTGVTHRLPRTIRVPLRTASRADRGRCAEACRSPTRGTLPTRPPAEQRKVG